LHCIVSATVRRAFSGKNSIEIHFEKEDNPTRRREILPKKVSQRGFGGALHSGFAASARVGAKTVFQLRRFDRRDARKPSVNSPPWSEPASRRATRTDNSQYTKITKDTKTEISTGANRGKPTRFSAATATLLPLLPPFPPVKPSVLVSFVIFVYCRIGLGNGSKGVTPPQCLEYSRKSAAANTRRGVAFRVRGIRSCRRLQACFSYSVLIDATPGNPALIQHVGANPPLERATRAGAAVGRVVMLGLVKDHFRTSRCHSLMRLPSAMGDGPLGGGFRNAEGASLLPA
jgi:hypothetical protein